VLIICEPYGLGSFPILPTVFDPRLQRRALQHRGRLEPQTRSRQGFPRVRRGRPKCDHDASTDLWSSNKSRGVEIVDVKRKRSKDLSMKAVSEIAAVPVAVVASRIEAELIAGMLRSHGLKAAVSADDAGGQEPALQMQGVRVLVTPSDEASARRLLAAAGDTPS
jgi:hypothetical protein